MVRVEVEINSVVYDVSTDGLKETSIVVERDENQLYFRHKFNGQIRLGGDAYRAMEVMLVSGTCDECSVSLYYNEVIFWEGKFSLSEGEYDMDRCIFSFTPIPNDNYDQVIQSADRQFNLMELDTARTVKYNKTEGGTGSYLNCRRIDEVLTTLVPLLNPDLTFSSEFLTAAINPVTDVANIYRNVFIAQKSDIKRPNASEPVRTALITFNELAGILRDMLNVYWVIEGNVLKFEHASYFESEDVVNIKGLTITQNRNFVKYDINKRYKEDFWEFLDQNRRFQELLTPCFKKTDATFVRKIPVNPNFEAINLAMYQDRADSIGDDGWVVMRGVTVGTDFFAATIVIDTNLWQHNRFNQSFWTFTSGVVNSVSVTPDKIQELPYVFCDDFDPNVLYRTETSDKLGVYGRIKRAEYNTITRVGTIEIGYGYTPLPFDDTKSAIIVQSSLSPYRLDATFSEVTPVGFSMLVTWAIKEGAVTIDSDTETWNAAEVQLSTFQPNWDEEDITTGRCVELSIALPSGWDLVLTQPSFLEC
jgi:hypothetical protein